MSDWPDQISELQRNWVAQQQKLLSDWLDGMKGAGGGAAGSGWRQAADVMEQQVDSALEAQKQSLLALAENMENVEGAPETFSQAVKQLEEGVEQWTEVQHKMWRVWFDMMRAASPAPQTPGGAAMEHWEDMVKRTMSIQDQWLSKSADTQSPTGGAAKKKAKKQAKKKAKKKAARSS